MHRPIRQEHFKPYIIYRSFGLWCTKFTYMRVRDLNIQLQCIHIWESVSIVAVHFFSVRNRLCTEHDPRRDSVEIFLRWFAYEIADKHPQRRPNNNDKAICRPNSMAPCHSRDASYNNCTCVGANSPILLHGYASSLSEFISRGNTHTNVHILSFKS